VGKGGQGGRELVDTPFKRPGLGKWVWGGKVRSGCVWEGVVRENGWGEFWGKGEAEDALSLSPAATEPASLCRK